MTDSIQYFAQNINIGRTNRGTYSYLNPDMQPEQLNNTIPTTTTPAVAVGWWSPLKVLWLKSFLFIDL